MVNEFLSKEPSLDDYWRGIILYGRNSASYKFALAKSLLEISPQSGQLLKLYDLAPVFARHIIEHIKHSPKQGTNSNQGKFLQAINSHGIELPNNEKLIEETVRYGFVNVINAFHIVGSGEISKRFYIDERSSNKGIRITEEFSALQSQIRIDNLQTEVESRWRLVETAWGLGISANLIQIQHDAENKQLFTFDNANRRKTVTSSRGALNGYQRGKCFYCRCEIDVNNGAETDVDHFFPHVLAKDQSFELINGIWNLVLSCKTCNAGVDGKHAKIPTVDLLSRLHKRNNYLIDSHHPLRETLMNQTGKSELERRRFLGEYHSKAISKLFHTWQPEDDGGNF
jgi:hypothetical protein